MTFTNATATVRSPQSLAAPGITLLDHPAPLPVATSPGKPARRTADGGVVNLRYELKTQRIRQCYRRDFPHLDNLLQSLARARDFRGVDRDFADQLDSSVSASMAAVRRRLAECTVRTQQLLARHQLSEVPIHYASPLIVAAPISTPHAREYLETLVDADDTFVGLEHAWLLGLIDTGARRDEETSLRVALRDIGTTIRRAYSEMARHIKPASQTSPGNPTD